MLTVIDVEVTYQGRFGSDESDPTPYNKLNKLVSVGYRTSTGERDYFIFHHNESKNKAVFLANVKKLQDILAVGVLS